MSCATVITSRRRHIIVIVVLGLLLAALASMPAGADHGGLHVTDLTDAELDELDLAESLGGEGVTVAPGSVSFTGDDRAAGTVTGGTGILGFAESIVLSSGRAVDLVGPNEAANTSTALGEPGDSDLADLAGTSTNDAAVLEFDFDVESDAEQVFFQYVFGSEEYNEFVGSQFNDVFGFWVNDENCAVVGDPDNPGDTLPVAVNTINNGQPGEEPTNPNLYINNDPRSPDSTDETVPTDDLLDTEMDGLTVVLTCEADVSTTETNTMRMGIADAQDAIYDSWVLIDVASLTTTPPVTEINLTPDSATNDVGTDHTLTAEAIFRDNPSPNAEVGFEIVDGPHAGLAETVTADASGIATFTYTGTDVGTDTIEATFEDPNGVTHTSDQVTKTWVEPDPPGLPDDRVSGTDRIRTSVELSQLFDSAETVVLARADDYPDSLAGAPLATQLEAPILLTDRRGLSSPVVDEIQRLGASHAVLLGGEAALEPGVVTGLQGQGITDIDRYGGAHRFETAALIADEVVALAGPPSATRPDAYLVEGQNADPARGWPDAVGVSALAAFEGTPILLAVTDDAPSATRDALDDLGLGQVRIVGGTGALSDQVRDQLTAQGVSVDRIFGANRYATSAALAEDAVVDAAMSPQVTYLATGGNWPDSLSAAPVAGSTAANLGVQGGVLLLVDGRDLGSSVASRDWLEARAGDIDHVTAVGGTSAISDAVLNEARSLVE